MYFDGVDDITVPYVDELRIQKDITVNTDKSNERGRSIFNEIYWSNRWTMASDGYSSRDDNDKFAWSGRSAGYWDNVEIECPYNNCGNRPSFDRYFAYTYGKEIVIDEVTSDTSEVYKASIY